MLWNCYEIVLRPTGCLRDLNFISVSPHGSLHVMLLWKEKKCIESEMLPSNFPVFFSKECVVGERIFTKFCMPFMFFPSLCHLSLYPCPPIVYVLQEGCLDCLYELGLDSVGTMEKSKMTAA